MTELQTVARSRCHPKTGYEEEQPRRVSIGLVRLVCCHVGVSRFKFVLFCFVAFSATKNDKKQTKRFKTLRSIPTLRCGSKLCVQHPELWWREQEHPHECNITTMEHFALKHFRLAKVLMGCVKHPKSLYVVSSHTL